MVNAKRKKKELRTAKVFIRATEAEKASIDAEAARRKRSISSYLLWAHELAIQRAKALRDAE